LPAYTADRKVSDDVSAAMPSYLDMCRRVPCLYARAKHLGLSRNGWSRRKKNRTYEGLRTVLDSLE
jgi:hypothetical protein